MSAYIKTGPRFEPRPTILVNNIEIMEHWRHRLNIELDLQSLFELHLHSCSYWLRPPNSPPPRIWAHIRGSYWSAKIDLIFL
jgi:hypothetical protein